MDQLLVVQVYQAVGVSSEIGKDTGFSRAIGISSSFAAVLWGLWDGLNLCLQLHLQHVEVELDAKAVLVLLSSNSVSNSEISALVFYCRELLKRIPHSKVMHCFRVGFRFAFKPGCSGCWHIKPSRTYYLYKLISEIKP